MYREAGGITTSAGNLRVGRLAMLKALGEEMTGEEVSQLSMDIWVWRLIFWDRGSEEMWGGGWGGISKGKVEQGRSTNECNTIWERLERQVFEEDFYRTFLSWEM
jgi:hypothetical protein